MSKENKSQKIENREVIKYLYQKFDGIIKAEDASQINHILINCKTKGGGMTIEQLGKMITDLAGVVKDMGETLGGQIAELRTDVNQINERIDNLIVKNNLIT